MAYSDFLKAVDNGTVKEAEVADGVITGKYTNDTAFKTYSIPDATLTQRLTNKGVTVRGRPQDPQLMQRVVVVVRQGRTGGGPNSWRTRCSRWRCPAGPHGVQR